MIKSQNKKGEKMESQEKIPEMVKTNMMLPRELHTKIKILAVKGRVTISQKLIEILEKGFKNG